MPGRWQPGERIDDCVLVRRLAHDGMGDVFLARADDGRGVVVKTLPATDDERDLADERRQRFLREVATLARLNHPHIARVRRAGHAGGQLYLAMDAVPGVDLRRYTRPARLLPEPLVVNALAAVADALAYAHASGLVHRDVKPANILLDLPSGAVTLTDFGIASQADAERTRTGRIVGTPAYMAPEQLAGAEPGPAADVYALGVTAFELLAGRRPHEAESMGALLRAIATGDQADLARLRPELPQALPRLVHAMLDREPARRPGASDVRDLLRSPPAVAG